MIWSGSVTAAGPDPDLLRAIEQVESGGDPSAIGDEGKAVGILQIHKVMVDDVNRIVGRKAYTYGDRFDADKSREMFWIYSKHYTPSLDREQVSRRWNGGPRGAEKSATVIYWLRVKSQIGARPRNVSAHPVS